MGPLDGLRVNRNRQKFGTDALRRRLQGLRTTSDSQDMLSRGKNIYNGVSFAAQRGGGPQYGRPVGSRDQNRMTAAINRRVGQRARRGYGGY